MKFDSQDAVPVSIIPNKAQKSIISNFYFLLAIIPAFLFYAQSSWGQIAQRGTATINSSSLSGSNRVLTVNKPTGVQSGDVMIASIVQNETDHDNGVLTANTASGWTLIRFGLIHSNGTGNNDDAWYGTCLYRIADGTEGNNFTFAMPNDRADMAIGSIVAFSGVSTNALRPDGSAGGPFDVVPASNFNLANSATATAIGLTVANNNSALVMLAMVNNDRTYDSWSNSQTELFDNTTTQGDDASIGAAWTTCNSSGTTGNRTVTISSSDRNAALLLVLRSASSPSAGSASSTPTLCINTALTNITHTTTGATGIGTATGLPSGVTASWASNTITISGTPTASGTFNYSIPLVGSCAPVNATGTITVNTTANPTATAVQNFCGSPTVSDLSATGTALKWYSAPFGGSNLPASSVLTSGLYFVSQTIGCGESSASSEFTAGLTTFGSGTSATTNRGLVFDLTSDIVLKSFKVNSSDAGSITVTLTNAGNNASYSKSKTINIAAGSNTINVEDWGIIPLGTQYRLLLSNNPDDRDLSRTEGFTFPLLFEYGSITGNFDTGGNDRYNFFYDWKIQKAGRTQVQVVVSPLPSVTAGASITTICLGNSVDLTSSATNTGENLNLLQNFDGINTIQSTYSANAELDNNQYAVSVDGLLIENEVVDITTANITNILNFSNKRLEFRLASIGSSDNTVNGADNNDSVTVFISLNGGNTWSREIQISGRDNDARWSYTGGTGVAQATWDGDNTPQLFRPESGGTRTTDGFSTVRLNLPDAVSQVRIRIRLRNDGAGSGDERWAIDNISLTGTAVNTYQWSSNPAGFTSSLQNPTGVSPSATTTYTVTATNSYGCASSANTTVTVNTVTASSTLSNGDFVWDGKVSNDYTLAGNWSMFNGSSMVAAPTAPTSNTNVIIPNVSQTCVANTPNLLTNTAQVNNLTIEANGSLVLGSGNLNIRGNYRNNGVINPGTATVAFMGNSGDQTITKSGGETFAKMTVTKASGDVILENNVTVTSELRLIKGLVILGSNDLILGSANVSDHSSQSYVKTSGTGTLSRLVGTTARIFPVGKSTYNPATLRNVNTASITTVDDNYSVRVVDNVSTNGANADSDSLTNQAVIPVTWMVNEQVTGGSNITMKLDWNGVAGVNSFNPVNAFMAHYISSAGLWDNIGGAVVGTTVEAPGIQSFSPFTISSSGAFAPLPIELVSFQANCAGDENINITWTTASEHNTSHYVVEHSRNGNEWEALTILAAAGNSTSLLDYTYVHENPNAGTNYYRLTQYDNDGEFEQFNAVAVDCDNMNSNTTLSTYPNPSEGSFYISLFTEEMDGEGVLTIRDTKGAVVHTQDVSIQKGNSVFYMNNMQVAPGMYYIQVTNGNKSTDIVKHSLR